MNNIHSYNEFLNENASGEDDAFVRDLIDYIKNNCDDIFINNYASQCEIKIKTKGPTKENDPLGEEEWEDGQTTSMRLIKHNGVFKDVLKVDNQEVDMSKEVGRELKKTLNNIDKLKERKTKISTIDRARSIMKGDGLNEEFSFKKILIAAGIVATVALGSCSDDEFADIAYNVSKNTEIKKGEATIAKTGKIIHIKRSGCHYFIENYIIELDKHNVIFLVGHGRTDWNKGDIVVVDIKRNGKSYISKGDDIIELLNFDTSNMYSDIR